MREILFRGKSKNSGRWVYGDLITQRYNSRQGIHIYEKNDKLQSGFQFIRIDKNTIGQYTGLTDKNGKKIFEGDIVELVDIYANYSWTAIVEFGNPNGEYVWGWNLKPTPSCCISRLDEFNKDILCWVEIPYGVICKIIGNIYDNHELVEKVVE